MTDLTPIDGHFTNTGFGLSSWLTYEPLVAYDDNLMLQPVLAESWELSSDAKQLVLNLRKGVQYHNGRELTSDDVLYNFTRIADPKTNAGILTGFIPPETTWTAKDKYTVVIATTQPWSNIYDFLSLLNMVNKEFVEGPNAKSGAVGTGPFTLQEWVPGDHVTFGGNKNYWQSGRPYLDGIQLTIARDAQSQMVQFESGTIDFTVTPPLLDYARLKSNPQYQAIELPNPGYYFIIQPNPNVKPFDDKRARQALNYAIDRNRIAATGLMGLNQPRDLPWPPGTPADEPTKQTFYNHDLDKAKSLLSAAGLSNMSFEIIAQNTNPSYRLIAEVIQGDLASIGVTANLTLGDRSVIVPRQNQHQFQVYSGADFLSNLQPVSALTGTASLSYLQNNADFKDDQYTKLVTSLQMEPDPGKQKALFSQINDFLLDMSFQMPIASSPTRALASTKLHGVGHRRHDFFLFTDAWLE